MVHLEVIYRRTLDVFCRADEGEPVIPLRSHNQLIHWRNRARLMAYGSRSAHVCIRTYARFMKWIAVSDRFHTIGLKPIGMKSPVNYSPLHRVCILIQMSFVTIVFVAAAQDRKFCISTIYNPVRLDMRVLYILMCILYMFMFSSILKLFLDS